MAEWLERAASGRSTCRTCEIKIGKGTVRVAEEDFGRHEVTVRFHHLRCVLGDDLNLAQRAVLAERTPPELREVVMPEIDAEAPRLAADIRAVAERPKPGVQGAPLEPFRPAELVLLERLREARDDRATWAVLADALAERGDPRGELISLDLSGREDAEARLRRRALQAQLAPERQNDEWCRWANGFIVSYRVPVMQLRTALFAHPSLAMLRMLEVRSHFVAVEPPAWAWHLLPESITTLRLSSLVLDGLERLAAPPGLHTLELDGCHGAMPFGAAPAPAAVTSLVVTHWPFNGGIVERLVAAGWFGRLERLALQQGQLAPANVERLARGLQGRRLKTLDVTGVRGLEASHVELQALCETLVGSVPPPPAPPGPSAWVHTGKPEWGTAREVARRGGMLELEFEGTPGLKRFKLGSPFLKATPG